MAKNNVHCQQDKCILIYYTCNTLFFSDCALAVHFQGSDLLIIFQDLQDCLQGVPEVLAILYIKSLKQTKEK